MASLDIATRIDVFDKLKLDPTIPTIINGIFGFGSGSFLQHDYVGGFIGLIADTSVLGIAGYELVMYYGFGVVGMTEGTLLVAASGVYLISKVIEVILPSFYSADFNKRLLKTLNICR